MLELGLSEAGVKQGETLAAPGRITWEKFSTGPH